MHNIESLKPNVLVGRHGNPKPKARHMGADSALMKPDFGPIQFATTSSCYIITQFRQDLKMRQSEEASIR
jgi:hypothetical protein